MGTCLGGECKVKRSDHIHWLPARTPIEAAFSVLPQFGKEIQNTTVSLASL
jgi:hypothetical protein